MFALMKRTAKPFQEYFPLIVRFRCYYTKQRMLVCFIHVAVFGVKLWLLLLRSDKEKNTDCVSRDTQNFGCLVEAMRLLQGHSVSQSLARRELLSGNEAFQKFIHEKKV
jgi:hypothetical protein